MTTPDIFFSLLFIFSRPFRHFYKGTQATLAILPPSLSCPPFPVIPKVFILHLRNLIFILTSPCHSYAPLWHSCSFPSFPRKRESRAFIKEWIPDQVGDDRKKHRGDSRIVIPFLPSCRASARHLFLFSLECKREWDPSGKKEMPSGRQKELSCPPFPVIPAKAGIQSLHKRMDPRLDRGWQKESRGMTKDNGSPIRSGMTEKSTGVTVELSFPNVPIGNPEHSEGMDPHFHGDDKKGARGWQKRNMGTTNDKKRKKMAKANGFPFSMGWQRESGRGWQIQRSQKYLNFLLSVV